VRLTEGTKLGARDVAGSASALKSLSKEFRGDLRIPPPEMGVSIGKGLPKKVVTDPNLRIGKELMDAATAAKTLALGTGQPPSLRSRLRARFAHVCETLKIKLPVSAAKSRPGLFLDAAGQACELRSVTKAEVRGRPLSKKNAIKRIADETIQSARRSVAGTPVRVFVDVGDLDEKTRKALQSEIERQLAGAARKNQLLNRIHLVK